MTDNITEIPTGEGVQPLTNRERFEEQFPHVAAILKDEEDLQRQGHAAYNAREAEKNRHRVLVVENEHALYVEQNSHHRSDKREERLLNEREKLKAARADAESRYTEAERNRPHSMMHAINEFFNSRAAHLRYRAAGTTDELLPGLTPPEQCGHYRERLQAIREAEKAVTTAPQTFAETEAVIAKGVAKEAAKLQMAVAGARKVTFDAKYRTFTPRGLVLPKLSVADGLGGVTYLPDGLGVLAALFGPEMVDRLTAMAREGHDESRALDAAERTRRLAAVHAERTDAESKAEFWHRQCRAIGANPGPRASTNVLAILDLVRA